jgi:murein DD-endopeptidase MepM/ murein hydrolase activator NlpD
VVAEDGNPDVPIGETEGEHLGGNVVVIEFGPDLYVQLPHLRSGSVAVAAGQQVRAGDVVGRCGNSGHSLEPHLHLQVQDTPASDNHHHRGDGVAWSEQAELAGSVDGGRAAVDAEFAVDRLAVRLDRVERHVQFARDLALRQS